MPQRKVPIIMKKALFFLFILTILMAAVGSLADNAPVICDDAELLSEDEESELNQVMNPLCSFGIPVFWTTNQEDSTDTFTKAKDFLVNAIGDNEGVAFVIDMYNRELVIYSTNQVFQCVTTSQANRILDSVYKMATGGNYLECAKATFAAIFEVLNRSGQPESQQESSIGLLNYHNFSDEELRNIIAGANVELQSRKEEDTSETYTACASFYILAGNPNLVNYSDSSIAENVKELVPVIEYIFNTDSVLDRALERLKNYYECIDLFPEVSVDYMRSVISVESYTKSPRILLLKCTTSNPMLSASICNSIADVGLIMIRKIVMDTSIEIIEYAAEPQNPD